MYKLLAALVCLPLLSACTKAPPKCSDPATTGLVKQILLDKLGVNAADRDKIGVQLLDSILSLENTRPSAFDEKIRKVSCEATLVVNSKDETGNTYRLPLNFESQLDDQDNHVVAVTGLLKGDLQQIDMFVGSAIVNATKQAGSAAPVSAATSAPILAPVAGQTADDAEKAAELPDTVEKSGVCKGLDLAINVENSECLGRKFQVADKNLNDEYKRAMALLDEDGRIELRDSQRTWIKEKEEKCEEAGKEFEGGTLQPIVTAECMVRMTDERSAFLSQYQ